jgi:hypothetical protein
MSLKSVLQKCQRPILTAPGLLLASAWFAVNHAAAHGPHKHPVVPEVNTGLVLIPVVIAILLLASRQLFHKAADQKQ